MLSRHHTLSAWKMLKKHWVKRFVRVFSGWVIFFCSILNISFAENQHSHTIHTPGHREMAVNRLNWNIGASLVGHHNNLLLFVLFRTIFRSKFGLNVVGSHRIKGKLSFRAPIVVSNFNEKCLFPFRYWKTRATKRSGSMQRKFNQFAITAISCCAAFYWEMCW